MLWRSKLRRILRAADAARDRRDWPSAARAYRAVLDHQPQRAALWLQYGHALKESGDGAAAEEAYLKAAARDPDNWDVHAQIGHARKLQGHIPEALDAYRQALRLNPDALSIREDLVHLGGRDALPEAGDGGVQRSRELIGLKRSLHGVAAQLAHWDAVSPYAPREYDAFRKAQIATGPPSTPKITVRVLVDARFAPPAALRTTLLSLRSQSLDQWEAVVEAPVEMEDHPVASLCRLDARIRFGDPLFADGVLTLVVEAGTFLEAEALAWFAFAAERHDIAAFYADHDSSIADWREGSSYFAPRFYPMFDSLFFADVAEPPLVMATRHRVSIAGDAIADLPPQERRRALLLSANRSGAVAHIPLLLSSRITADPDIRGPVDDVPRVPPPPRDAARAVGPEAIITVIIPTRDAPDLLRACVDTLRDMAERPDLLDIIVVDNRSQAPETEALLRDWAGRGVARLLRFDEPFNWSRVNNVTSGSARGHILLFLNNDTEMLTRGWDRLLSAAFAGEDVGAVGCRLLYPDRTLQHGGVVLGVGPGSPTHEGVGASEGDGGPLGRWRTRRAVSAVTGAFLATRRASFEAVSGFDEVELPVGFNDIDFCLRLRALGLLIVYEPAIELIHAESKTRGHNDTTAKLLWDRGELASFFGRWGRAALSDPGYNPHWNASGRPFDGFRHSSMKEMLDHLDDSSSAEPWRVVKP